MEHKTSHKGPFCEIEIYIRHWKDEWVYIGQYLGIWGCKTNLNIIVLQYLSITCALKWLILQAIAHFNLLGSKHMLLNFQYLCDLFY